MRFVPVIVLLALSTPAFAGQTSPEGKKDDEKKICRSVASTGSMMSKRECHTREEWRKLREATEDNAGRDLDQRRAGSSSSLDRN